MSSNSIWPENAGSTAIVNWPGPGRHQHRFMDLVILFVALLTSWSASAQTPDPAPAAGMFLVASRDLQGPIFTRTVILLLQYDRSGAMGLIVNRPTEIALSDAIPGIEGEVGADQHLYFGGPVSMETVLFITRHGDPRPSGGMVLEELQVSGDLSSLQAQLAGPADPAGLKVFAGYSGWAPGQLEAEIRRGGWHLVPARAEQVLQADGEALWRQLAPPPTPLRAGPTDKHEGTEFPAARLARASTTDHVLPHPSL